MLNGGVRSQIARELVVLLLMLMVLPVTQTTASAKAHLTLSGIIYFTNNTPRNVAQFAVELFTRDQKRRIAATTPNSKSRFTLTDLESGRYLLKLTWPNRCVLWYRVNLAKKSMTDVRIIMDVDCAHFNGTIQDLPEN